MSLVLSARCGWATHVYDRDWQAGQAALRRARTPHYEQRSWRWAERGWAAHWAVPAWPPTDSPPHWMLAGSLVQTKTLHRHDIFISITNYIKTLLWTFQKALSPSLQFCHFRLQPYFSALWEANNIIFYS